jgi:hypothetical protein
MFTTEIRVGRLYEHRILSIEDQAEIEQIGSRAKEVLSHAPGKVVVCADYRALHVLSREHAGAFVSRIGQVNPNLERTGILIRPEHAVFNLQIARMVREMAFEGRKVFREAAELAAWLGEVLNGPERARLEAFLAEPVPEAPRAVTKAIELVNKA